jgi:hypothetical protein
MESQPEGKQRKEWLDDRWFYLAVILLAIFFLFKLINQSQIILQFPLDQNNDLSGHVAHVFFLAKYGFHGYVPNWYNGYLNFLLYPPVWAFTAFLLYKMMGNLLLGIYTSHILIYALGLLIFLLLGKISGISKTKILFLYLMVYANPISIGNFVKLGRLPELLGLTLFILFFIVMLHFKDNKINRNFLWISVLYAAILLSHPAFFIISSFFVISLFLMKRGKQKISIIIMFFITLLLSSFWLIPFIIASKETALTQDKGYIGLSRLLDFRKEFFFDNLFSFILPVVFWFVFYFYYKSLEKKEKIKELTFYSISLIFSIFFFSRIAAFIPIINHPYPDSYNIFLIFVSVFLFFQTSGESFMGFKRHIKILIILSPFLLIIPSMIFVPNFRPNNDIDKQVIKLLPSVTGKFLIYHLPYPTSSESFYAYAAVYYNLSTPSGWYPQIASQKLLEDISNLGREIRKEGVDCEKISNLMLKVNAREVITYQDYCNNLEKCGKLIKSEKDVCLISIE